MQPATTACVIASESVAAPRNVNIWCKINWICYLNTARLLTMTRHPVMTIWINYSFLVLVLKRFTLGFNIVKLLYIWRSAQLQHHFYVLFANISFDMNCVIFRRLFIDRFYYVIFRQSINAYIIMIPNRMKTGKITPHIYIWNALKYITQGNTESLSVAPLTGKANKSFAIPISSCIAKNADLCIIEYILRFKE